MACRSWNNQTIDHLVTSFMHIGYSPTVYLNHRNCRKKKCRGSCTRSYLTFITKSHEYYILFCQPKSAMVWEKY